MWVWFGAEAERCGVLLYSVKVWGRERDNKLKMSFTDREKASDKALKRLYPFLIKNLHPDVRHELYARDMLTWHDQQTIGKLINRELWFTAR